MTKHIGRRLPCMIRRKPISLSLLPKHPSAFRDGNDSEFNNNINEASGYLLFKMYLQSYISSCAHHHMPSDLLPFTSHQRRGKNRSNNEKVFYCICFGIIHKFVATHRLLTEFPQHVKVHPFTQTYKHGTTTFRSKSY